MRERYDMPEWLLWALFVVVMLPVAALCLALIYALMLIVYLKLKHLEFEHHRPANVDFGR